MRENVKIQMPSFEGLGLDRNTVLAFDSTVAAIQRALDKVAKAKINASDIEINIAGGASLEDLLPWPGTIRMVYAKWAAMYLKRGWRICDGTKGTPQIHPHPTDGGSQRFLRATAWGVSPNDTAGGRRGGAAGHSHTVVAHDHDYTDPTDSDDPVSDAPSSTVGVAADAHGTQVATGTHTHVVDHAHSNSGVTGEDTPATDSQAALPPYCDVIVMMYVGQGG